MRKLVPLTTILAFAIMRASSAQAAESIVGLWAPDPGDCTPIGGMVSIGPLSLTGDELACTFSTVSRAGDVVTWHGRCSNGETDPKPSTVTAALRGGTLAITIDGASTHTLRRCPRR